MSPDQYCQAKVTSSSSSFRLSFLLLASRPRRAITALYAFCREVDDIVDEGQSAETAHQQLQQWRHELDNLYAGTPSHPITQALAPFIDLYNLEQRYHVEIINGMEMDIEPQPYADLEALNQYCYRVAGVVGILAARIFGGNSDAVDRYAVAMGLALQLTNILRDVREDYERDRIYLPRDWMEQFEVSAESLGDGETSTAHKALLSKLATTAEGYYHQALGALPVEQRRQQISGLVMGQTYHTLLMKIRNHGYPVLERRATLSTAEKLWCVVGTWLRGNLSLSQR